MSEMPRPIETITRAEAVSRLRAALLPLTDEETCMCKVAAERRMFCGGFSRYTDGELRDRYDWIVRKRPGISREELESIANDWQLAQQDVRELPFACDVQTKLHDTCKGWHDFTDADLAGFYRQVTGDEIRVVS